MKTQTLRVRTVGVVITSLLLFVGCEEGRTKTEEPVVTKTDEVNSAELDKTTDAAPQDLEPQIVQPATMPEKLKPSPALAEVIKLAQAGVDEQVLLAYITNSTELFNLGSDGIVYLNDLGVTTSVITSLIQHDASPEMLALKKSGGLVKPLPLGVALTTPATGVYPGAAVTMAPPTNLPPAMTEYAGTEATPAEAPEDAAYFYGSLAPYGNWINIGGYGLCWQPTVAVGNPHWRPYGDRGRWLWSDNGWYWYSDYSWGWAPFHYGRWCSYPSYGWVWVPDTCWGPSWVTWRYTSSHCGWAPLPPGAGFVNGFGLCYGSSAVGFGFGFGFGAACYSFVPWNNFCRPNPVYYSAPTGQAGAIYSQSVAVNNIAASKNAIINNGVGVDRIRGTVPRVTLRENQLFTHNNGTRPERLEKSGSSLVLTRPPLLKESPSDTVRLARTTDTLNARPASPAAAALSPSFSKAVRAAPTVTPSSLSGRVVVEPSAAAAAPSHAVPLSKPESIIITRATMNNSTTRSTMGLQNSAAQFGNVPRPQAATVPNPSVQVSRFAPATTPPVRTSPAPAPVRPDVWRVYPEGNRAAQPVSPRSQFVAPPAAQPFNRSFPATGPSAMPVAPRPEINPAPPGVRAEPGRAPSAQPHYSAPAAVRAAPAQSSGGRAAGGSNR